MVRDRSGGAPLDAAGLERLALHYVGRYATSTAKLAAYLARKLAERGWAGPGPAGDAAAAVADRMASAGYVDDAAFAEARGRALGRRGYGARRIGQALRQAGIAEADRAEALSVAVSGGWDAALALARRRRLGPYAAARAEGDDARRAIAVLLRAGHDLAAARRIVSTEPGQVPADPAED